MHMPAAQSPAATSIGGFWEVSVKYLAFAPTSWSSRSPSTQPCRTALAVCSLGRPRRGRPQRIQRNVDPLLDHVLEGHGDRPALCRVAHADLADEPRIGQIGPLSRLPVETEAPERVPVVDDA